MMHAKRVLSALFFFTFLAIAPSSPLGAESVDDAVKAAEAGDLAAAVDILEKMVAADPADADALAYLGLYTGMSAGQATDYSEAGRLAMKSFELLDKAVETGPENAKAYFFRGVMALNVPDFMGKLDPGLKDLEKAASLYYQMPEEEGKGPLVQVLKNLADGYARKGDDDARRSALERLVVAAPESAEAAEASKALESLPVAAPDKNADLSFNGFSEPSESDGEDVAGLRRMLAAAPGDEALLKRLAEALYSSESYEEAAEALKSYTAVVEDDAGAWKTLAMSIAMMAQPGYDEKIHDDTNYRSRLAFDAMKALDRAVELSPGDMELRLTRGIYGVTFPFFLRKFDQGVEDLEIVAGSEAPRDAVAEANFYLGYAKQREATRYWIKVAKKFEGTEAEQMVYEALRPRVARFDAEGKKRPFVMVGFVLGFEDELAPQTAVWIEDEDGEYVATLYVSGFAGYVKEAQVTLPAWAEGSGFEGIDAVTHASIDLGQHIYTWDLNDYRGEKVKKGRYKVRVETLYWPSMKGQLVETEIEVGKKDSRALVEEGNLIPRLEVRYYRK